MEKGYLLLVLAGLLITAGCGTPSAATDEKSLFCSDTSRQVIFDAAVKVLEDMHFDLETADESAGLIRTWPMRGSQFFEPWRGDTVSVKMAAYSNLHSIRHIVEIELISSLGKTCVECKANAMRLSIPGEFTGGNRQMASLFTGGDAARQSLVLEEQLQQDAAWIDLGPDTALEKALLKKIENNANKGLQQ